MEMEIEEATEHGVNVFIYDWYWYDGRPFQENCLNSGFLKTRNRNKMKFFLMWANHDFNHVCDIRLSGKTEEIIWKGAVSRKEFEYLAKRTIEKYFKEPNYYCIHGEPVFQIYDLRNFVLGMGGFEEAKEALQWFRKETIKAGFPGLYLMLTVYSSALNLSGVSGDSSAGAGENSKKLGFSGITHYEFVHFTDIDRDYREIVVDAKKEWERLEQEFPLPYYPHISMGWDNNPRFLNFRTGVVKNNTPEEFEKALKMAKAYLDTHEDQAPLVVINSWNEWTESSYLEPDDLKGYGYLEAVARVFGKKKMEA